MAKNPQQQKKLKIVELKNNVQQQIKIENHSVVAEDTFDEQSIEKANDDQEYNPVKRKQIQKEKSKINLREKQKQIQKQKGNEKQKQKEKQKEREKQKEKEKQLQKQRLLKQQKQNEKQKLKPRIQIKLGKRQTLKKETKKITKIIAKPPLKLPQEPAQNFAKPAPIVQPFKSNYKNQLSGKKQFNQLNLPKDQIHKTSKLPSQKIIAKNSNQIIINKFKQKQIKPKLSDVNYFRQNDAQGYQSNHFVTQNDQQNFNDDHIPIANPFKRTFQQFIEKKPDENQMIHNDIANKKRKIGHFNYLQSQQPKHIDSFHYQQPDINKISSPFAEEDRLIKSAKKIALQKAMNIASERKQKQDQLKHHILKYNEKLSDHKQNHQKQQMKELYNAILANQKKRDQTIMQKVNKKFKPFQNMQQQTNIVEKSSFQMGFPNIFNKTKRYKKCEEFLQKQKRISLRNLLRKQIGKQITKHKVKIVQVLDEQIFESQLGNVKVLNIQAQIDRLQMLIKVNYGWVAIGRSRMHGLFKVDVNLLPEYAWKVLQEIYIRQC